MDRAWAAFREASDEHKKKWENLIERQSELSKKYGSLEARPGDILQLNVGGFTGLCCLRSTLTVMEGSILSAMFSGRWDKRLPRDTEGRIFVDEDPYIFQMLIGYLKSLEVLPKASIPFFVSPW